MPIDALSMTVSDIVAGQKIFASKELERVAEVEAWANTEVIGNAVDKDSAQVVSGLKDFSNGDYCYVKTQTIGDDTDKAASTEFVNNQAASLISNSKRTMKAWCRFAGTGSTPITPADALNVSSVTKNGTGDYTVNFTTPFNNTNYAFTFSHHVPAVALTTLRPIAVGTGNLRIQVLNNTTAVPIDADIVSLMVIGGQ